MTNVDTERLIILYGSQTFTAQEIAERIWRKTKVLGFKGPVQAMDDYPISRLIQEKFALFVCATTGQGDEPDNMRSFWKFLLRKSLPTNSLVKLKFGVIGLGDSSYTKFNFVGKKLHKRLIQLGAKPLLELALCDYQHDLGHDAVLIPWLKDYFKTMKIYFPDIKTETMNDVFVPRWKVSLIKNYTNGSSEKHNKCNLSEDIYYRNGCKDHFVDATYVELEKNVRLTDENHFQDVRHIVFKTTDNTTVQYSPGDIFNIRPRNSREDVDDLFDIFATHNLDIKPHYQFLVEECHDDMPVPEFLKQSLSLYELAEQYWDLRAYPTQYFFALLSLVSEDKLERDKCIELSSPEGQEDWLNYCRRTRRTVLEVLHDFHESASKLTIEVIFELLSTIKPRSFSIAGISSRSIDLLVAVVEYQGRLKRPRLGLASTWLRSLNPGDAVYGWIKNGSMKFPDDTNIPLILVGPGTGLAPFRSLLHHRRAQGTADKDTLHLVFGCRYRGKDFLYREELEGMVERRELSLYCAFSRDQEDKVYVQHKIIEHKDVFWPLIKSGAHIYISGNAKNMPDSVREAFVEVIQEGGVSLEEAKQTLSDMERKGRLQVETW